MDVSPFDMLLEPAYLLMGKDIFLLRLKEVYLNYMFKVSCYFIEHFYNKIYSLYLLKIIKKDEGINSSNLNIDNILGCYNRLSFLILTSCSFVEFGNDLRPLFASAPIDVEQSVFNVLDI